MTRFYQNQDILGVESKDKNGKRDIVKNKIRH